MLYDIGEIFKGYLSTIDWADRVGGLVQPISPGEDKVFPAYLSEGRYTEMTPDSKLKSVLYVEGVGEPNIDEMTSRRYKASARVRVVCWYNLKRINPDALPSELMYEVINAIPHSIRNNGVIIVASIMLSSFGVGNSAFSAYTYDEQKQYTVYPYGAFYVDYEVTAWVSPSCSSSITQNEGVC